MSDTGCEGRNTDPGPVPTDPPAGLTLKNRIELIIENHADGGDPATLTTSLHRLVDALHAEIAAGADWTPRTENEWMTPGQALAWLLDATEEDRLEHLGRLIDAAISASHCFEQDHIGRHLQDVAMRAQAQRWYDALTRIARMTATVDQPTSRQNNIIGQIAAEALVRQ